jgi:hypothetical protein
MNYVKSPRILTGPSALKVADQLRKHQSNQELWPYEWLFPPKYARRVRAPGTLDVATMVAGTQAVIVGYTVPTGFSFVHTHILRSIGNATGFIEGSGNALWSLDVNIPLGVPSVQGYQVQGFALDSVTLGSFNGQPIFPWPMVQPEIYKSLDLIQDKVTITVDITGGIFYSCLIGYLVPGAASNAPA